MSNMFEIKDGLDFYNEICPEKDYLVDEIIGAGDLVVLAGDTGLGKSLIAHQIGVSLAVGESNVLGFEIQKQRRVLYLNFELSNNEFNRRHRKIASKIGANNLLKNFNINVVGNNKGLFEDNWERIIETIKNSYPYDLIIVDNLYASTDVNDERNFDLKRILKKITEVANVNGSAVLLVTHHRKHHPEENLSLYLVRGGSTLTNAMDMVLQVGRSLQDQDLRYLTITKNRYYSPNMNKALGLRLDQETLLFENVGEISEKKHLTPLTEEQNIILNDLPDEFQTADLKKSMKEHGYSERAIYDWLRKFQTNDHIKKQGQGKYSKN